MLETDLKSKVIKALKNRGLGILDLSSIGNGVFDLMVYLGNKFVFLELKLNNRALEDTQKNFIVLNPNTKLLVLKYQVAKKECYLCAHHKRHMQVFLNPDDNNDIYNFSFREVCDTIFTFMGEL